MATELSGSQKAAMLVMALKDEQAAELLKHMSDKSIAKLRKAAESLDMSSIGDREKRDALIGFIERQRRGGFFVGDPQERFRKVLTQAKGDAAVRTIYGEGAKEKEKVPVDKAPLEAVNEAPEEQLAAVLADESPRSAAVLLSAVAGDKAGRILNMLEDEHREAIVGRIITTESVPPEIAEEVLKGVKEKLEELASGGEMASEERRAQELARMVATLDKESQERVLSQINQRDPELGDTVERLIFGFEDLLKVDSRSMQELARNVEVAQIALALKGAPEEIQEHFNANMSQRARERVEEEREMAGRVPLSQVEVARDEVMKIARRMYREGELVVAMGDEQYVE